MPHPPPTVTLLRHGETEWSRDGRHTGRIDIPLTDTGRRQALAAADELAGRTFARILVSPLQRARETAALAGLGERAEVRPALMEWDYGDAEGLTRAQVGERQPGWSLWRDGVIGGETVEQVGERADTVIAEVLAVPGDVILIAHGHLLRVLAARWLGLPPAGGRLLVLDTASISLLGHEHENASILHWNDVAHLRGLAGPR